MRLLCDGCRAVHVCSNDVTVASASFTLQSTAHNFRNCRKWSPTQKAYTQKSRPEFLAKSLLVSLTRRLSTEPSTKLYHPTLLCLQIDPQNTQNLPSDSTDRQTDSKHSQHSSFDISLKHINEFFNATKTQVPFVVFFFAKKTTSFSFVFDKTLCPLFSSTQESSFFGL